MNTPLFAVLAVLLLLLVVAEAIQKFSLRHQLFGPPQPEEFAANQLYYWRDARTNQCYASTVPRYTSRDFRLTAVPCTPEILNLIPTSQR